MRFEVPQFIEVEDKIFGPLTFKQFVYLAGGGGLCVIIWIFVPKIIGIFLILAVAGFALALAFYQPNNKPFVALLEAALRYGTGGKLYIWKKEEKKAVSSATAGQKAQDAAANLSVPRLSDSRLRDLAWSLDVHDSLYSDQAENK
ncbi:MAG: PrgI family protein [Patescibacteria group bacterium]